MASLVPWKRPTMLSLQRDIADVFDELSVPRSMRREVERLFDDVASPRSLWREMERLIDDLQAPPMLGSRIGRIFEDFLGEPLRRLGARTATTRFVPSVDLTEQGNEYCIKVDLPGMREQDIEVRVTDDNMLTISGERQEETHKGRHGYEYTERAYGAFTRSVELPGRIDPNKVVADFRNGVLELHVPKTEAAQGRRIPLTHGDEPRVISPGNGQGTQPQGQRTQSERNA